MKLIKGQQLLEGLLRPKRRRDNRPFFPSFSLARHQKRESSFIIDAVRDLTRRLQRDDYCDYLFIGFWFFFRMEYWGDLKLPV